MIFFDTSTCIALLHGKLDIMKLSEGIDNRGPYAITSMSVYELYFGIYALEYQKKQKISRAKVEKEKLAVHGLLNTLQVFNLESEDSQHAAEIYHQLSAEGHTIEEFDCIIAAIVLNRKGSGIITENVSHFQYIKDLTVINSKVWNIVKS